ncbi:MAG: sulfatase-like hydrolase/transferase, partial [Acidobacteria bacterium]|nr:sulfatase-like hydrolase/transferase [Acidobacteriota bacterium]
AAAATPPIVLVVFDALPTSSLMDDRHGIDAVRYPNFARLASEGTWYRRASSVSPVTIEAVPAILAGQCPGAAIAPTYSSYPRNLFSLLSGQYDLRVAEPVTQLCHPELCGEEPSRRRRRLVELLRDAEFIFLHRLLPTEWTASLPAVDNAWGDFGVGGSSASSRQFGADMLAQFRELVARVGAGERPELYFAHLVLPHAPFFYLPSGARYRMRDREPAGRWKVLGVDPWVANHSYQRHLLQLGFVDSLLGELLERLDGAGIYDDALVIVTADHGSSFRPGESRRTLSGGNAIDILAVPLFVKLPGQKVGGVSDRRVQTVDIVGLVADTLGLESVSWSDGRWDEAPGPEGERVSCSAIEGRTAPDLSLAELFAAAERKSALFGTGRSAGVFPAAGPRPEVVGLPAATGVCQERAGLAVKLAEPALYDDVDPGRFVPAEIVGMAQGAAARSVELAIAVNGVVAATTLPYELGTKDTAIWAAIVPESALRAGHNDIQVLAIDEFGSECLLRPVRALAGPPSFLDSRLGVWRVPEVAESGFHATLSSELKMMRWTNGRGRLRVPLDRAENKRLRALRVELGAVGETGANLTIRVNHKTLGTFRIERAPWSRTFELGRSSFRGRVKIRLVSDTFMSNGRKYGVGVDGIWLLSSASDGGTATDERR